jgi:hypothetical protein
MAHMRDIDLHRIRDEIEAILASRERWDWHSDTATDERYRELCNKETELLSDLVLV